MLKKNTDNHTINKKINPESKKTIREGSLLSKVKDNENDSKLKEQNKEIREEKNIFLYGFI